MSAVLDQFQTGSEFGDYAPLQPPTGTIRKEETRYLFNALDVITPKRKRDCRRLAKGGHEVQSYCLSRTRGFLRKGRITPLDMGGEPILEENAPDDSSVYQINNPETPVGENARVMIGSQSPLVAIPAYPGLELPNILNGSANNLDGQRFCLVEIKALIGHKYRPVQVAPGIVFDPDVWEMQQYIFPDYPEVPVLLDDAANAYNPLTFAGQIRIAHRDTDDQVMRSICEDALSSCEQGVTWANERIESEHRLMKQGALASGFAYVYSELAEILLVQLGLPRQDQELKNISELAKSFASGQGNLDIGQLLAGLSAQNQQFAETLLKGLTAQLQANQVENKGETVESGKRSPASPNGE